MVRETHLYSFLCLTYGWSVRTTALQRVHRPYCEHLHLSSTSDLGSQSSQSRGSGVAVLHWDGSPEEKWRDPQLKMHLASHLQTH